MGHVDWDKKVFVAESFKEIDHGHDFYAAQTTEGPEGERVMIAWMHTWGRPLVTNDLDHKWYGQMTLPRILKKTENGLHQVLPTSVFEAFKDIEIGQSIQGPSKLSLRLEDSLELKLETTKTIFNLAMIKPNKKSISTVALSKSSKLVRRNGQLFVERSRFKQQS